MTARVERAAIKRPEVIKRPRRDFVEQRPAPFSLRCGAALIDYILLVGIVAFSTIIARWFGGGARTAGNSAETVGVRVRSSPGQLCFARRLDRANRKQMGYWPADRTTGRRRSRHQDRSL